MTRFAWPTSRHPFMLPAGRYLKLSSPIVEYSSLSTTILLRIPRILIIFGDQRRDILCSQDHPEDWIRNILTYSFSFSLTTMIKFIHFPIASFLLLAFTDAAPISNATAVHKIVYEILPNQCPTVILEALEILPVNISISAVPSHVTSPIIVSASVTGTPGNITAWINSLFAWLEHRYTRLYLRN